MVFFLFFPLFSPPLPKLPLGSPLSWIWKAIFGEEFRAYRKHKRRTNASNVKYQSSVFVAPCIYLHSRLYVSVSPKAGYCLCISTWKEWLSGLCNCKWPQARLSSILFLLHWSARHHKVDKRMPLCRYVLGVSEYK